MTANPAEDVEARFQAGMAMLAGAALHPDWKVAVEHIDAAAAAGHANALERQALLECIGFGRPANWDRALDLLAEAAARGSQSAARQLVVLAEDRYRQNPEIGQDLTGLRKRISIEQRVSAPDEAGRMLSTSPIVHAVPGFASAAECRWLIDAGAPRLDRAPVYNVPSGIDPGRSNQFARFDFASSDLVVEMIRQRIANQLRAPLACLEMSQVLHYGVGQEFVLHCDFLDPQRMREEISRNGQRVATVLIYLNEDFAGGETSFPRLGINHRASTGDALIFGNVDGAGRPDERSQHAGCPPTSGEKWVFSQWVRNQAPSRGG